MSEGRRSALLQKIEDMLENFDERYGPSLDEWNGVLPEDQLCEGLFPFFASRYEVEKVAHMKPCNQKVGFKNAIIGFHAVPNEHPNYPEIRYLCIDCHEILDWQLWSEEGRRLWEEKGSN